MSGRVGASWSHQSSIRLAGESKLVAAVMRDYLAQWWQLTAVLRLALKTSCG